MKAVVRLRAKICGALIIDRVVFLTAVAVAMDCFLNAVTTVVKELSFSSIKVIVGSGAGSIEAGGVTGMIGGEV